MSIQFLVGVGIAAPVWTALVWAWCVYDNRVRYGPIIAGNARWRREQSRFAREAAEREALAALTADDREWLTSMGWKS